VIKNCRIHRPPGDAHSHEDADAASAAVLGADGDN